MGNDVVADFLQNLPRGLIIQVCGAGLLFMVYLTYAFYIRPLQRRNKERAEAQANTPPGYVTQAMPETATTTNPITLDDLKASSSQVDEDDLPPITSLDTGDLPPLDDLLVEHEPLAVTSPEITADKLTKTPAFREIGKDTLKVKLNRGDVTEAKEVLTILRDEDDGRLMILIGDKGFRTIAEDAEAKNTFKTVMKELSAVITKPDDKPLRETEKSSDPTDEKQPPSAQIEDTQPEAEVEPDKPIKEAPAKTEKPAPKKTVPPPPLAEGTMPGDLPSFKLEDNPAQETTGRFGRKKLEYEPVPELDIAGAIEAYLQYKLQHTEDFQGRELHIRPSISGGVRIQVDDKFYDFVDEVEEPDVRAFLQEAIAEWQDRQ